MLNNEEWIVLLVFFSKHQSYSYICSNCVEIVEAYGLSYFKRVIIFNELYCSHPNCQTY